MSIPETVKTLESYSGSSFCPEDFTAFWKEQNQNAAQPRPVVWNRVPFHNPMADYWELTFPATDGKLLTARFLRPKQGTPAPVVLMFHDHARRTRGWHHMTRFIALDYAVLALENREGCYSLTKGWEDGPAGLSLTQLYTDALTAAHLAGTLPGVDSTRMLAWGEGLGGGLAIVTAAMLPGRVVKCAALHPMPADFYKVWESGVREGLCAGLREQFRNDDPAHDKEEALFRALGYVDLCGFAPLLRGELLLGTGLMDTVALPAAQYAVYNRARSEERRVGYPNYLHERINFFENELVGFFRLAFD